MQRRESSAGELPSIEAICGGDAWEMGFSQGRALRTKIQQASSVLSGLEAFRLQKPQWMPLSLFRRIAETKATGFLDGGLASALPEARRRLEGLAAGAGVRVGKLHLLNAMEAVLSDISRAAIVPIAAACSALAVTKQSSRTGDPILAHNFDYLPAVRPLYTVRECRPVGKLRSLEFTAAPMCGAVDGVNEAGLCLTYNYAYVTDKQQAAPTISMWISEALSCCRTVPQAIEFLSTSPRWGGGFVMLGDAEGRIAALEISNTRCQRTRADYPDRLFHTNRFETATMTPIEVSDAAVYCKQAPRVLRNRRVHQSSELRDHRLQTRLAALECLDAAGLLELMSDHGPHDQASADTICMHSEYWHTTACLQLLPRQRQMRVAYDSPCRADLVTFSL